MGARVLLLRGVNVGGAGRLPMADFRDFLARCGAVQAQTYIQSGNAVYSGDSAVDARIQAGFAAQFGFSRPLFFYDLSDYAGILDANPFAVLGAADGAAVHIAFLAQPLPMPDFTALAALAANGEALAQTARALYLHAPNGIGRSVLAAKLSQLRGTDLTVRNQRSAMAIAALAQSLTC